MFAPSNGLPGESRPYRFEPLEWPPKPLEQPEPAPEKEPTPTPAEPQEKPEKEPTPA
jgi:hypothetical protein